MARTNKEVFTGLHMDYFTMVFQMCKGFAKGDADLAKDLTQDVFINTWNALDKFKGASSYKTWIYRITVNTCLKFIRDRKDQQKISLDEILTHPNEGSAVAEETPSKRLYHAIGQLCEIDRLIIIMVLDELEYNEIANVIGISSVNLRVKIHRIRKQLKTILEND
jgi:RNA polymerase sigma factor (sigma-70 family)